MIVREARFMRILAVFTITADKVNKRHITKLLH